MNPRAFLTPARMAASFPECFPFPFAIYRLVQQFEREAFRLLRDPTCNRLTITVPIGHGKSSYWSQAFPAWVLASHPNWRVLLCSSSHELAIEFSATVQRLLREVQPYIGFEFDANHSRRDTFRFTGRYRGGLDTAGVGKAIQGRRYDLIIADDLVASDEAARSPTQRNSLWKWWTADCVPRLQDHGKVVNVMSRRHTDDVVGKSLALNPQLPTEKKWREVKFKAIGDDGKALWPGKWPLTNLLATQADFEAQGQSYQFSALFQQDPRGDPAACEFPDSYFDGIFFDELPPNLSVRFKVVACDPSKGSKSKAGDYSAILTCVLDGQGTLWITDAWLRQVPLSECVEQFAATIVRERPHAAIIETALGGELAINDTQRLLDAADCRCSLYPYQSHENKVVRIRMGLTGWLAKKRLRVKDCVGGRLLVGQTQEFPSGEHDDGPDCGTMAISLLDSLIG